jgi:para-nitrobenzyl esterase
MRWSGLGATHGTELLAVFDTYRSPFGSMLAAADRRSALRVSDDVQARWRAFSETGVPGEDWPAYTETDRAVMVFDRRSRIDYDPHAHRRLAWDEDSRGPQREESKSPPATVLKHDTIVRRTVDDID